MSAESGRILPGIKKNVSMKDLTTFRVGGKAEYSYTARNVEELKTAVLWAKKRNLPFFILGNGSNLLVSDKGFKGIIIRIDFRELVARDETIMVGAGVPLSKLVIFATKNSLTGLEWMSGIPGTVGGAVRGNAGAFGSSIGDSLVNVVVLDFKDFIVKILKNTECRFGYRDSIFKKNSGLAVLSAEFALKRGDSEAIQKKVIDFLGYRIAHHPKEPSAGSIFKNIKIKSLSPDFFERFPDAKQVIKENSLPVAYLIAVVGLVGVENGGAKISEIHPNFIVNFNNAKAKDIISLIDMVKQKVRDRFGIKLEEEIQYLGF